jgi:cytochrome c
MLRLTIIPALAATVAAIVGGSVLAQAAPAQSASTTRGYRLAQGVCGQCHAIGPTGESPKAGAPPFRDLSRFEPGRSIDEIFAKGILVGHPGMPSIGLSDRDQNDLLAYLRSIQPNAAA